MSKISKFFICLFLIIIILGCVYLVYQNYTKSENNDDTTNNTEEVVDEADLYEEEIDQNIIIYDFISNIEESNFVGAFNLLTSETKKNLFNNNVEEFKKKIQEKYYNNDRIVKNLSVEEIEPEKNIFNILFQIEDTDDIGENYKDPLFTNNFIQVTVEQQIDNTVLMKLEFIEINKSLG